MVGNVVGEERGKLSGREARALLELSRWSILKAPSARDRCVPEVNHPGPGPSFCFIHHSLALQQTLQTSTGE